MEKAKRCFSRRLFSEKSHSNRTGACMGANDASNAHIANGIKGSTPKITAVLNVLLQQNIRQAGIAKEHRFCKVDSADFLKMCIRDRSRTMHWRISGGRNGRGDIGNVSKIPALKSGYSR